jgi:hypothetical protein
MEPTELAKRLPLSFHCWTSIRHATGTAELTCASGPLRVPGRRLRCQRFRPDRRADRSVAGSAAAGVGCANPRPTPVREPSQQGTTPPRHTGIPDARVQFARPRDVGRPTGGNAGQGAPSRPHEATGRRCPASGPRLVRPSIGPMSPGPVGTGRVRPGRAHRSRSAWTGIAWSGALAISLPGTAH